MNYSMANAVLLINYGFDIESVMTGEKFQRNSNTDNVQRYSIRIFIHIDIISLHWISLSVDCQVF